MFTNLPKDEEQKEFKSSQNKMAFLKALPNKFQRKVAVEIGKSFNLAERTVGDFLKNCLGKYLSQPKTGWYEKI
jgi:hypothetical protein